VERLRPAGGKSSSSKNPSRDFKLLIDVIFVLTVYL